MRMLKLEMKRILKTRLTIVLLCLSLFLTVILAWLPVTFCYSYATDADGNTVNLTGMAAIKNTKEVQADIAGAVTAEKMRLAVERYQACLNKYGVENSNDLPDGVYAEEIFPYEPLISGVKRAFTDPDTGIAPSVMEIEPESADDFYGACEECVVALMKKEQKEHPAAQEVAAEMYRNVEKPYLFFPGYNRAAIDYQMTLAFLTTLFCAVIAAPVFTSDYQTGADDILRCTKYGGTKFAVAKIVSALLLCGAFYGLCTILYLVLSNSFFGWETIKSSVQMEYPVVSLPNMDIGQFECFTAVAGLLCILATVSLTLFLSSKCKNMVVSLAAALLFCILPFVLYLVLPSEVGNYVCRILPSSSVCLSVGIPIVAALDFAFWNIGDIAVWVPNVMVGACVIEIPLFAGAAVFAYSRGQ